MENPGKNKAQICCRITLGSLYDVYREYLLKLRKDNVLRVVNIQVPEESFIQLLWEQGYDDFSRLNLAIKM